MRDGESTILMAEKVEMDGKLNEKMMLINFKVMDKQSNMFMRKHSEDHQYI